MQRIHELPLPAGLSAELAPLVAVVTVLTAQIDAADERLAALVKQEPAMQRLQTLPGIGPVTACAVVASADAIHRFPSAHEFEAYLGLVPSEQSSGEKRRVGAITKTGNAHVRWLLIEAAWRVLRSKRSDTAALRVWARRVAARRGKWVAVVALARRLAGILYAMWRDEVAYDAKKIPLRLPRARA
jgi:transposase